MPFSSPSRRLLPSVLAVLLAGVAGSKGFAFGNAPSAAAPSSPVTAAPPPAAPAKPVTPAPTTPAAATPAATVTYSKDAIALYTIHITDQLHVTVFGEDNLNTMTHVDANGNINLNLVGQVKVLDMTLIEAQHVIEKTYQDKRLLRNPKVTVNLDKPAPRSYEVQGDVKGPGTYYMEIETAVSVVEAISKSGGFNDTAKSTDVRITHFDKEGNAQVRHVDVYAIIHGTSTLKANDNSLMLEPGDIVYVPMRII